MQSEVSADVGPAVASRVSGIVSVRLGVQKTIPASLLATPVRPYLSCAVGALIGFDTHSFVGGGEVSSNNTTMGAFGVTPGLGVDFVISRRIALGARMGYNFVTDFDEPLAGKTNYSGWEFTLSVGWLWGKGFAG
jgi:hypothetical protein